MKTTMELCKEAGFPLLSFEGMTYVSPELERLVALVRADERAAPVTKDEALDLALEALEGIHPGNMTPMAEEYWNKAITAIKQARALDKKAENARELGLDYEPADGTQVSKVWWDGEKLMAKPIPLEDIYLPAPKSEKKHD
jgi:hypothetical protein